MLVLLYVTRRKMPVISERRPSHSNPFGDFLRTLCPICGRKFIEIGEGRQLATFPRKSDERREGAYPIIIQCIGAYHLSIRTAALSTKWKESTGWCQIAYSISNRISSSLSPGRWGINRSSLFSFTRYSLLPYRKDVPPITSPKLPSYLMNLIQQRHRILCLYRSIRSEWHRNSLYSLNN